MVNYGECVVKCWWNIWWWVKCLVIVGIPRRWYMMIYDEPSLHHFRFFWSWLVSSWNLSSINWDIGMMMLNNNCGFPIWPCFFCFQLQDWNMLKLPRWSFHGSMNWFMVQHVSKFFPPKAPNVMNCNRRYLGHGFLVPNSHDLPWTLLLFLEFSRWFPKTTNFSWAVQTRKSHHLKTWEKTMPWNPAKMNVPIPLALLPGYLLWPPPPRNMNSSKSWACPMQGKKTLVFDNVFDNYD